MLAKKEILATSLFVSIIFIPLRCRKRKKTGIIAYHDRIFLDGILALLFSQNLRFCMQIVCDNNSTILLNVDVTNW